MSNPQGDRSGDAARERAARDDRERRYERPSGLSSCPHGRFFLAGQPNKCPACAQAAEARDAAEAAKRAEMVSDARNAAERRYDDGTPLAETNVAAVETCGDDDGRWTYVPVASFLAVAPAARVVAIPGRGRLVVAERENGYPLAWR